MKRIKFFLPLVLVALFAGSTFAQGPRAIDLEKVKMNADIAKELNAIIKANKVALNAMSADHAKAKKMQWREELREMYGWYNEGTNKDADLAFVKEQIKKANAKKWELSLAELKAKTVGLVPRIVEDKNGEEVTYYETFSTDTDGLSGKKLPQGTILLHLKNPALKGLDADAVPTQAQAQKLLQGQKQGIINGLKQLAAQQAGANADENLPGPRGLQAISKQLVGSLGKATYTPPTTKPQQKPIGYDQNDNPIFEAEPGQKVIGHNENDQPVYFNINEAPNPAYYKTEADFLKARKMYVEHQRKHAANDYILIRN